MNELIATPVVKNKFWVVENQGEKIATIQAREGGGFVYVHDNEREYFNSTKDLKQKLKIKFESTTKKKKEDYSKVYGYPIKGRAFNEIYDVVRKLPIYSKNSKSKSLFCAGYYVINFNNQWICSFCPKNITLNRYKFIGPFKTEQEALLTIKEKYANS